MQKYTLSKLRFSERATYLLKLSAIYFLIQLIVRIIFVVERTPGFLDTINVFLTGFLWDSLSWLCLSWPLLVLTLLLPKGLLQRFNASRMSYASTFLFSYIWIFVGFCEVIFWNEFHSRFNFIAVDYLIYTNEVLANLRESFPVPLIFASVGILSLVLTLLTSFIKVREVSSPQLTRTQGCLLFGLALPLVFLFVIGPWLNVHEENFHDDQLSRNGLVEFVRAFRSNKIDYKSFYAILPEEKMRAIQESKKVSQSQSPFSLEGKKPNVVMIVVESLGAKFIRPLGGQESTTPYLNALADQSIFFEQLYSTGTRTVRGLEAINLSVPPTPGYAVVKRPDHKDLFSMGHTFKSNGYDPIFLYGGRGFFDNMNSFFSGNGFQVIDQTDFTKEEITFSNAWGVCDEDMFNRARREILSRPKNAKPFLFFMLTTSNHRPFTYPPGKIDIPSGESRAGAVKYTDYAIGKFLDTVKNDKWAQDTIFVIIADHSTEGRGQFDLEMTDFHIPLWIYSPKLLRPQRVTKLGSQIDLLPSLVQLLGLKDDSPFFGRSFFNEEWKDERAFVGNYQYVGYYKDGVLTTLGPNRAVKNYSFDPKTKEQRAIENSPFVDEAISYYQSAAQMLDQGKYKPKN